MIALDLSEEHVLITGALSVIGESMIRRLLKAGANPASRATATIFERFPGLDIAIGHAGGCAIHPFAPPPLTSSSASSGVG